MWTSSAVASLGSDNVAPSSRHTSSATISGRYVSNLCPCARHRRRSDAFKVCQALISTVKDMPSSLRETIQAAWSTRHALRLHPDMTKLQICHHL